MRLVPSHQLNTERRYNCIFTGRTTDDEGMFVGPLDITPADHPDLSATAVKEMARQLGWLSPSEAQALADKILELNAENASLRNRIEKIDTFRRLEAELVEEVS